MTVASAPVAERASATWRTQISTKCFKENFWFLTELNTGKFRCSRPPFPGLTPPTIFVPYSIACCEWKVPCLPVKP